MYPFFETIKIESGKIFLLPYHQSRINTTFKVFYPDFKPIQLQDVLQQIPKEKGVHKCRFSYNATFFHVEYELYQPKIHEAFKCVEVGDFDYSFKFTDRKFIEEKKAEFGDYELIFTRNGALTDTTYSNLIFYFNGYWYTPKTTLLKGTQRAKLLDEKKIIKAEILLSNVKNYSVFKLINAMMDETHATEYYTDMIEF